MSSFASHYVGLDLTAGSDAGPWAPVSRVTLYLDDDTAVTAGDDTGAEISGTCAHATQAMAEAILARVRGYVYRPFTARDANIDPAAELGDGVHADGVYGLLARYEDDGRGYMSLSAPGQSALAQDLDGGYVTRGMNRKLAAVRSSITKTAEEIRLEVTGTYATKKEREDGDAAALASAKTMISQTVDRISLSAENASDVSFLADQRWTASGTPAAGTLSIAPGGWDTLPVPGELLGVFFGGVTVTVSFDYRVTGAGLGGLRLVWNQGGPGSEIRELLSFAGMEPMADFQRFSTAVQIPAWEYPETASAWLAVTSGEDDPALGAAVSLRDAQMIVRGGKSSITLRYDGVEISSADVTFSGMVTFEDLATPGSTVISGSNLRGGTACFGGADNGSGVIQILDASGKEIGRWDNGGISATNGTFSGKLSAATGSINGVGGSFNGTHTGGGISGCTLKDRTGGTYVGTCSGSTLSGCGTGGTTLGIYGGSLSSYGGSANLHANGILYASASNQYFVFGTDGHFSAPGDINCGGKKSRAMGTEHFGVRLLDALETPLPTFSDYGTAALDGTGVFHILMDPVFAETVDRSCLPTVFLTKYGPGDLWVEAVAHDAVTVRGTPGLVFAWETRYAQGHVETERLCQKDRFYMADTDPDFHLTADIEIEKETDYALSAYEYFTEFERSVEAP